MNKIQSKKQLLKEISVLVDDYINYCLHKKPSYEFKIEDNLESIVGGNINNVCDNNSSAIKTEPASSDLIQNVGLVSPRGTGTTQSEVGKATSGTFTDVNCCDLPISKSQGICNESVEPSPSEGCCTQSIQNSNPQSSEQLTQQSNHNDFSSRRFIDQQIISEDSEDPIKILSEMPNPHSPFEENEMTNTKKKKVPAKVTKKQAANIEGRKDAKANPELSKQKCIGLLTNWKRCTRDKDLSASDPELCSFHNNPKFIGKIEKLDLKDIDSEPQQILPTTKKTTEPLYLFNPAVDGAVIDTTLKIAEIPDPIHFDKGKEEKKDGDEKDESNDSEDVHVFIKRDEDGDFVDQDANIWDVKEKKIIGKKDLMTKQKIFFQKI